MRKTYAIISLALVAAVFVFAIVSFLRENWGADETPGTLEAFVAKWVLSRARQAPVETKNPLRPTEENLQRGRALYEKQCSFCHGLDGGGQSQNGIQFYPPVPSLIDPSLEVTAGQIHSIVSRGIRYTAMPSFAKVLPDEDIWKIVLWVRHLAKQSSPAPTAPLSRDASRSQ